jgi:hypothetical protein
MVAQKRHYSSVHKRKTESIKGKIWRHSKYGAKRLWTSILPVMISH